MYMSKRPIARFVLSILVGICGTLTAQTITGSIGGTVVDPSETSIAGAAVTLVNEGTGETRKSLTKEDGTFLFLSLQPGRYTIRVERAGFQTLEQTGYNLIASERLGAGILSLKVGAVNEKLTVSAQADLVQTTSSERGAVVTSRQIDVISVRGRDQMALLRLLPGTSTNFGNTEALGTVGGTDSPNINGLRRGWNNLMVDGVAAPDLASPQRIRNVISFDATSEVKVVQGNFQAEYGRSAGAQVNIITKSGSREFRGSAYGFKRHENFNANNFFNNLNNIGRPIYRYGTNNRAIRVGDWCAKARPRPPSNACEVRVEISQK